MRHFICSVFGLLALSACTEQADKTPTSPSEETEEADSEMLEEQDLGPVFAELSDDGASVAYVEAARYLGVWYEISSVPMNTQAACTGTTAEYGLIDEETISVHNRCWIGSLDGQLSQITGKASILDDSNARLAVDFGFGFAAPYFIVERDDQPGEKAYEFAAVYSVGSLWVLSRTPTMEEDLYNEILNRLEERDYPIENLVMTVQPDSL